ncbi:MAG TPA: helix-turn-helix domain-containing protein [Streptosporangiaceae bacterium]|nr:helix-turn-helix domain-containing protein [Streptosporangiaceae bacterium]
MVAAQKLTVRQAAKRAGRSEETIRRWIWSGRLPAVKRGTSYRIDVGHLAQVMVDVDTGAAKHAAPNQSMLDWLEETAKWKAGLKVKATPGVSAADLIIEDRRARR